MLAIMIPVYNDWESLHILLQRLDATLHPIATQASVYVVDDGSPRVCIPASLLSAQPPQGFQAITRISLIRLQRNMGHQSAVAIGLSHLAEHATNAQYIIVMDADGEDKPEDIPLLLHAAQMTETPHIVFAQRQKRHENGLFKISYRLFKLFHRLLTGQSMDIGNFSVIPIPLLASLLSFSELWRHYPATVLKAKLPYKKVRCDRGTRIRGISQMSFVALILHGLSSISVFSLIVGIRMLIVTSLLIAVVFFAIVLIVGIRLFTELAIPGWATYTVGLCAILIVQFIVLSFCFIFLILSSASPPQSFPSQYRLLIESTRTLWER